MTTSELRQLKIYRIGHGHAWDWWANTVNKHRRKKSKRISHNLICEEVGSSLVFTLYSTPVVTIGALNHVVLNLKHWTTALTLRWVNGILGRYAYPNLAYRPYVSYGVDGVYAHCLSPLHNGSSVRVRLVDGITFSANGVLIDCPRTFPHHSAGDVNFKTATNLALALHSLVDARRTFDTLNAHLTGRVAQKRFVAYMRRQIRYNSVAYCAGMDNRHRNITRMLQTVFEFPVKRVKKPKNERRTLHKEPAVRRRLIA